MKRSKKMLIFSIAGIVILLVAYGIVWHFLFGVPNPPLRQTQVTIQSNSSTTAATSTVAGAAPAPGIDQLTIDGGTWNVEIASTTTEQTRGLSYRIRLGANDGMLFIFSHPGVQNFWMISMNFPLDMIWIGDDGAGGSQVVGFEQNAPAPASGTALWNLPIYPSPATTDKVFEVNAGTVAQYNIKVGDKVTIGPIE